MWLQGNGSAKVFYPVTQSSALYCGWDDNGLLGGGSASPEPYNGTQTLYQGVSAGCPYTGCNSDGTRF
jgi:hypothetical protein